MNFSNEELRVESYMNRHKNVQFTPTELARVVFGDSVSVYINYVQSYLKKAQASVSGIEDSNLRISHLQDGRRAYSIVEKEELSEDQRNFQDFLAKKDVAVIERVPLVYPEEDSKYRDESEQIISILTTYFGYIIPYSLLCMRVYGTMDEMKNLKQNLSRLGNFYSRNYSPFTMRNYGFGIGLTCSTTQKLAINVLEIYWKSSEMTLSREILALNLWGYQGEMNDEISNNVRVAVRRAREALSAGKYTLERSESDSTVFYTFRSRDQKTTIRS